MTGTIINDELIGDGQLVVLGLSGGPDSVCLLYELLSLREARERNGGAGNPIVCAHVHHVLRGAEADEDEACGVSLCKELGVPVVVEHIDAEALARDSGLTVEEAGREARYAFFDEVCENIVEGTDPFFYSPSAVIAAAHNQDDKVETVLMRILRGTGTDGLAGIAERRKSAAGFDIVRPLLGVSRNEIDARLEMYEAEARVDGSNLNTEYFRNRLRLEVLPYMEEMLGSGIRQSLLRLAENAAEDKSYFDAVVTETLDKFLDAQEEKPPLAKETPPETPSSTSDEKTAEQKEPSPLSSSTAGQKEPSPSVLSLPAELLASAHPAVRHRLIRAAFAELGLKRDVASVHLTAADRLLQTWQEGGEASGKRVEFPFDYTFGIKGKDAVFRTPGAADPRWKPRRKR
jgi:tRNA(Ile)-lysidine synthase